MNNPIQFSRNYSDHSTNNGFQFEFNCDRCGNGFRTSFQPYLLGNASGALEAANSLFGGIFGKAADLTERVRSANWQKAHDEAFTAAINELRPQFVQCPRCSSWVCRKSCWNNTRGLCKNCAPDLEVERSAAQASKTVQAAWEKADVSTEDQRVIDDEKSWQAGVTAACPNCHAPLARTVKFCPECGTKIKAETFCTECGTRLALDAKFCPECGKKAA